MLVFQNIKNTFICYNDLINTDSQLFIECPNAEKGL